MTFRPSVVPEQRPDFLDTLTRSFLQARGLVEADTAAQQQRQQFRVEQQQAEFDLQRDRETRLIDAALDPRLVGPGERGFPTTTPAFERGGDVSAAIADQLSPRRASAQRRGQVQAPTTPAGDLIQVAPDLFVDPVGQEREATAASKRITEMLNSFAGTQDDPALGAALRAKIPGIVQQIELGAATGQAVNPAELLREALADIRQRGATQTGNRFLLSQLPQDQQESLQNDPEFQRMAPSQQEEFLEKEVASQRQTEAIVGRRPERRPTRPPPERLPPGALTDKQILDAMDDVLFQMGTSLADATASEKTVARNIVLTAPRGGDTNVPDEEAETALRGEGEQLLRQIQVSGGGGATPGLAEQRQAELADAIAELAELKGVALEREIAQLRADLLEVLGRAGRQEQ